MKLVLAAGLSFVCFSLAQAQNRAPGGVVYANPSGFGNVAFPGTGRAPTPNFSFPQRLGAAVAGSPLPVRSPRRSYAYAYPLYVGGYGGYGDVPQQQQQEPTVVIVNQAAPQQQAPTVIINQNFGPQPMQQDQGGGNENVHYFQPPSPAPVEEASTARYYLLAFKDASVYTALAYWVEDKTLHYVTSQNTHNQVSLDLVDLDFTKKLNQDRNVPFSLQTR